MYLLKYVWRYSSMARVPEIVPITDLRQDSSAVLKRVRSSREPVIITQRGRAAAVLLSVEEYERTENERQILLLLARGEKEIAQGEGHTLDDVLADADGLLAGSD
jgi:prevent-host-death family protein